MRLELTRSTDLALQALQVLSDAGGRMKRPELAESIGTTPHFVARVLGKLVAAGWAESESGRHGGYRLDVAGAHPTVLDVIEAVEGLPAQGECVLRGGPCGGAELCAVHDAWMEAREALTKQLAATPAIREWSE